MVKYALFLLLVSLHVEVSAQEWHVDFIKGNDANTGTKTQPLKTIAEAARRLNMTSGANGATIILSEGVHQLTETVLFNNNRFTAENRLVLRAEIMPDDTGWSPQRMPMIATVISHADEMEARGLEIEASHVTIEGLRFTGSLDYYYIDGKQNRRSYPIWRNGKQLDDLLITQCLFAGNTDVLPLRLGIIANGHGVVVDHCVFFGCENSVVYGNGEEGPSRRNVMRYCIVYGSNYTGIWTTGGVADDFGFHHNIIANSRTGWMQEGAHRYQVHDCILTGNTYPSATGSDAGGLKKPGNLEFLQMERVQVTGNIEIEKGQGKNNYLQLKEGSFGSDLKAGLFKK
ncbi:MAG: hypothetical protein JST39_25125 [Bacteroidetes bacterium]|nr:hypothetical protein [Bacteroidota bacterium]